MNKGKNNKPSKGVGFGDALFAIKNVQVDYEMFNEGNIPQPPKIAPPPPKKNPTSLVPQKKPANIVKPEPIKKPATLQQKQQSTLQKQQFKIAPGKQFQNHLSFLPLKVLACTNDVYELSQGNIKSAWEYNIFCDGVPADQIIQDSVLTFNFNAQDLKQGNLGNCYFVSSLAAIAHHPEILRARIPKFKEYNGKSKAFTVNMFQSGKCIEMVVDNLFQKLYCKPVLNDISPIVMQKAYAQSYGNFQVINFGHANDALRDLTGAPTVYLDFKNKEQFRTKIKAAFFNKYGVVIASKANNIDPSISAKHSYNVLSCQMIKGQAFLLLRDPRGWTKASFDIPAPLVNTSEMGMFWVNEKVLQQNFQVITICKIIKNYQYFYKTFSQKQLTNNKGALLMTLHRPMKVFATIHQKHKKFFDQKFSYDIIRVLIAKVSTTKNSFEVIRTLKSDFNAQQVCTLQVQLQAGSYILLGQIGRKKSKDLFPRQIFTLSIYSQQNEIQFSQMLGNIDVKPFLISYIRSNPQQFKQSSTQQGLYRYQGPLFGYICLYYQNRGKKKVLEEIEYTVKNIEISERKVQLAPGGMKIVMHPIGAENNCSHQCSMKSKTFYT